MQPGSIYMDDMKGRLPFRDIGIVLHPAKEGQDVAGLRPGWLEVVASSGERFALWLTICVDVDFAVNAIRASIGGVPVVGNSEANQQQGA